MRPRAFLPILFLALLITTLPAFAIEHAVAGRITRIDSTAKTMVVKLADGTEQIFHFTERTAVHAAQAGSKAVKKGAVDTYFAGKEGSDVVVRYTGKGASKTATAVDDYGQNAFQVTKGTVVKTDKTAHTVTVRTEDGVEHTYQMAKNASVDTTQGIVKGSEYDAQKGEKVVVHYSNEAGNKVAHFIKHW